MATASTCSGNGTQENNDDELGDSFSVSNARFTRQCTEIIDTLAGHAIDMNRISDILWESIRGCKFCVTIGDPRLDDCPLIAVSDQFETMTGFSKEEIVGKNCRFLNKDCLLNLQDAFDLRQTCKTGQPFTRVLLNRKKSGQLFQNLVDLRGLTVASNPHTRARLWFVVGIQADVTHLSEDALPPNHLAALQSVVHTIRDKISNELSTLPVSGMHVAKREHVRTDLPELWWMLPEPKLLRAVEDEAAVSPNASDATRQTSEELNTGDPRRKQTSAMPVITDMLMPESSIKETIGRAVLGCQFCVTVSDPRVPTCPLLEVSDHFQTITGYSREELVGKNVAILLESDCKLHHLDKERLRIAFEHGEPCTKVFLHRKKNGEIFLDFMDLRGLNVAHNHQTRDNLWFLVCIHVDVTHAGKENIPADQAKQLHEVAECIHIALADRMAVMRMAGTLMQPPDSTSLGGTKLWCPLHAVKWRQDTRAQHEHVFQGQRVSFASSARTTRELASEQNGDPATSSGVTEVIQQREPQHQQQQQQRQPLAASSGVTELIKQQQHLSPPQEVEPTLSTKPRWLHQQWLPAFVLTMGLLAAVGYLLRKRPRVGGAVSCHPKD